MAEFLRDPQNSGISGTNGIGEAEEPIQGHAIVDPPNNHLYSEVLREFTDWYFSVSPEDFDEELLDAYLEEMDELSPLEISSDSQASLEKFHERFPSLFKAQGEVSTSEHPNHQIIRIPGKIKKLGIVAAIIIGIFGMLVTAHAVGIDVLGAIGQWTEEIFHFKALTMSDVQKPISAESGLSYSECCELLDAALEECEIKEDLVPNWCPERFQASEPEILKTDKKDIISVTFNGSGEQFFILAITRYQIPEDLDYLTFEKDDSSIEQYMVGSQSFYILSNNNNITATWSNGLLVEQISGNLTVDEMKKIIDSIGGIN